MDGDFRCFQPISKIAENPQCPNIRAFQALVCSSRDINTTVSTWLGAVLIELNDGDNLTIIGDSGDYYVVDIDGVNAWMDKRFVRLASDEDFEEWQGYAKRNTLFFENVYRTGDPQQTLTRNTQVDVLADLGTCYKVKLEDGTIGFVDDDKISTNRISDSSSSGNNDNGGGSSDNGGTSGGNDGGDIILSLKCLSAETPQLMRRTTPNDYFPMDDVGIVLADGVEAYYTFLYRDDIVEVIETDGINTVILYDELLCTVPAPLLRLEGEEPYEVWEGYAQSSAVFYPDYRMVDFGESLTRNTAVQVLEDVGNGYYIQWEDGYGFIPYEAIDLEPVASSSGGGSSSGDNDGGGSDTGGGNDWTPPVL